MKVRTGFRKLVREGPLAVLEHVIDRVRENTYTWRGRDFSLREALLFPDGFRVDLWTRYSRVAAALLRRLPQPPHKWRILEIGAGGAGLAGFLRDREVWDRADLVVVDHDPWLIGSVRRARPVLADISWLPFADRSFDAVLAVDLLEHLPPEVRERAAMEMRRLARRLIICHCPVEGTDGTFRGRWADQRFDEEFRRLYRKDPPHWVIEHLAAGHPTPEELSRLIPGSSLTGDQNCEVWLRYMLAGHPAAGRGARFLTGLRYLRRWKREDNRPPFRSALLVLDVAADARSPDTPA